MNICFKVYTNILNCVMVFLLLLFKVLRHLSSISSVTDDFEEDANDRRERQLTGYIKFSTYKALFKAAHSHFFVIVVFLVFVTSQFTWSGADYFLSAW